jgi:hypothetical protein
MYSFNGLILLERTHMSTGEMSQAADGALAAVSDGWSQSLALLNE